MKAKTFFLLGLLILLSLSGDSCSKDSQEDPRFSCRINGELWNPKDGAYSFGLAANYDFQPDINRDVFNISATQHSHPRFLEVSLTFNKPLDSVREQHPTNLSLIDNNVNHYILDTSRKLSLILLKFDKTNRIAIGTFDGILYNHDYPFKDSIKITEGKFNVKF